MNNVVDRCTYYLKLHEPELEGICLTLKEKIWMKVLFVAGGKVGMIYILRVSVIIYRQLRGRNSDGVHRSASELLQNNKRESKLANRLRKPTTST